MCDSIKFTREEEHEGSLAFLDLLVTRTPEGSLPTTVFRKPTHTGNYQPVSFHNPHQHKLIIPRTLFSRAENIIKEDELKKDEIRTINNTLITNGYPKFHRKRRPAHSETVNYLLLLFFLIYLFVTAKAALPKIVRKKLPGLGGETSNQ